MVMLIAEGRRMMPDWIVALISVVLGAVISDSPISQYSVTRANTMAHQKVMEEVMKQYPMLPVRFGTVGEGTDLIRERILNARYGELKDSLNYMSDKAELGLKAIWSDIKLIFQVPGCLCVIILSAICIEVIGNCFLESKHRSCYVFTNKSYNII